MHTNKMIKALALTLGRLLSDETYIKIRYWLTFKKHLNLKKPKSYNEKIQWMKLYDRNPLYTKMVDKYEVRKIVEESIGEEYLIPCLGVWNKFDDINFDLLPESFVLKCTHDSGSVIICRDKKYFDKSKAKEHFEKTLNTDYYLPGREWCYKAIIPRIIAEQFMVDESGTGLKDYKFFCFDGKVKALFIATDRGIKGIDVKFDFFDQDFNHLPFKNGHENAEVLPKKPENFNEMKELAEKLAQGIRHVRVDLYNINGKIYFGELTFYHHCGFVPFEPETWDYIFGDWINLE